MRIKKNILILLSVSGIVPLQNCEIINPKEEIPAYVQVIDTSSTNPANIKDVWVYQGNGFQGAYELPAKFPILHKEENSIKLRGGVLRDGISEFREEYPFWKFQNVTASLKDAQTFTIPIQIQYEDSLDYPVKENFEGIGITLLSTSDSDTTLQTDTTDAYEGQKSGAIYLDANHKNFQITSDTWLSLPRGGAEVWTEVTYKNDVKFKIGLLGNYFGTEEDYFEIEVNPRSYWNKIYVRLTEEINASPNGSVFKLLFEGTGDGSSQKILLDDIKLIHFK